MASAAAMNMYNSLSPSERAEVDASIAGNPNGIEDWYQAAAKAGDPRAFKAGGTGQSEDFARFLDPGGEFNMEGQGGATLTGWAKQYYDEAASRAAGRPQFRSMRGAQGFFDKPTECPPGSGPSGPNETDPCTTKGYSEPAGPQYGAATAPGGSGAGGGAQFTGGTPWSPLQELLANQGGYLSGLDPTRGDNVAGLRGGVVGGGGIWYQPTGSITTPKHEISMPTGPRAGNGPTDGWMGGLPGPRGFEGGTPRAGTTPGFMGGPVDPRGGLGGAVPRSPAPGGFGTNALQNTLAPYQSGVSRPAPLTSALQNTLMPQQQQQTSPLTSMLQPYQKKRTQMGSWF